MATGEHTHDDILAKVEELFALKDHTHEHTHEHTHDDLAEAIKKLEERVASLEAK